MVHTHVGQLDLTIKSASISANSFHIGDSFQFNTYYLFRIIIFVYSVFSSFFFFEEFYGLQSRSSEICTTVLYSFIYICNIVLRSHATLSTLRDLQLFLTIVNNRRFVIKNWRSKKVGKKDGQPETDFPNSVDKIGNGI